MTGREITFPQDGHCQIFRTNSKETQLDFIILHVLFCISGKFAHEYEIILAN